ncbi:hypothetical protein [Actinocorallia longicatena]|uniref:Secreted protein n=1 Tax=Actinocorallia longicatena TaxID=111803 RepID=A0ABP6Q4Z1_9ACTN
MSRHRAPRRRRFHRLGPAALAVSASAFMVFGAAVPATAAPAEGKPKTCPKGTDPVTTWNNIVCQVRNKADDIKKKIDELTNKNKDDGKKEPEPAKKAPPKKKAKPAPPAVQAPPPSVPQGTSRYTVPLTKVNGFKRLPSDTPSTVVLPETPEVAGPAAPQAVALPETHLVPVSSVTTLGGDGGTALWASVGAGTAAGVVMLQFSVIGARLRRKAALDALT